MTTNLIRYKIILNHRYPGEPVFMKGWVAEEDPDGEWVRYAEAVDELDRLEEMLEELIDHEYGGC